jgi:hypothetical protein
VGKVLEAFKLAVQLDIDGASKTLADLKSVDRQAEKTEKSLLGLGSISGVGTAITAAAATTIGLTTALYGLAKGASDYGSMIYDAGQKTGFTTETLSALKYAADQSGSSFDDISAAIPKFERNLYSAAKGNKELAATFKALGVDVREGLKEPEAAFGKFLTGFQRLTSDTQRAAVAQDVFGKSGASLIPTFNTVGNSLEDYKRQVGALGLLLSEDAAAQADEFGDKIDELTARIQGGGMIIGRVVMPSLIGALNDLTAASPGTVSGLNAIGMAIASIIDGGRIAAGVLKSIADNDIYSIPGKIEQIRIEQRARTLGPPAEDVFGPGGTARGGKKKQSGSDSSAVDDELLKAGRRTSATKKHADVLAAYRGIQERVNLSLAFFGDRSEVASVKQSFLSAGLEKLTGKLRRQADELQRIALVDAQAIDARRAQETATAKAKIIQEQFNGVLEQQRDRLREMEGGESAIQHINRLLSDPTVAGAVDERTQSLLRLNAALIVGKESTAKLDDQFVTLKGSLVEQARDLRQQIALMGIDDPASRLRIQFDTAPLPKGLTNAQTIELVTLRRELINLTQQQYDIERAQAADISYRQLLGELNGQSMVGVVLTEQERVAKLLLTDAYAGLTQAQRDSLLVKAKEIDLQNVQLQQQGKMLALIQQSANFLPQQQVGKKRGFFGKLLGFAAPFLNFIPGIGPVLSAGARIASSALQGDWRGALLSGVSALSPGGAFRGSSRGLSTTRVGGVNLPNPGAATGAVSTSGSLVTGLPRRALGGPVSRGRAYLVGEHRPEVFVPEVGGFIQPSVDSYVRQKSSGSGHGISSDIAERIISALEQNADAVSHLRSMPPEHVVSTVAKSHPHLFGEANQRSMSLDPKKLEWMLRRMNGR